MTEMTERRIRRVKGMLMIFTALFLMLAGRLFYIQVVCGGELTAGALRQQVIPVEAKDSRGTIYDRSLTRLTGAGQSYYYLIRKSQDTPKLRELIKVINGRLAGAKGEDYVVYKAEIFNREVNRKLTVEYGAYAFCAGSRYEEPQTAAHLIGYVGEEPAVGLSGLEKMFQYRLSGAPVGISMTGNGIGSPAGGIGLSETFEEENGSKNRKIGLSALITTIDKGLQNHVEQILQREELSGAVVVTDVETGQILAMASSPVFSPSHLEDYMDSQGSELVNKAASGTYPPGSVFKVVTAAAALESGAAADYRFVCRGSIVVNGVKLICEGKKDGHGTVDMKEAFAKSCNCYFAHLGQMTGSETIFEMAERMGFGREALKNFPEEEVGALPEKPERSYSGLSNFSIGQGSLLVTPLQVARMTGIIASGGVDIPMSVVLGEGRAVSNDIRRPRRVMSQVTAARIQKMMEEVMISGTGAGGNIHAASAGKTGSAETSVDGHAAVHGWFTGYFPADEPTYAVTVLAENGESGRDSALPVFEEIANYFY